MNEIDKLKNNKIEMKDSVEINNSNFSSDPYLTLSKNHSSLNDIMILRTESYEELFSTEEGILHNSRFDTIKQLTDLSYVVCKDGKYGVYRRDVHRLIIDCEYDRIIYEGGDIVLLSQNGLWGAKGLSQEEDQLASFWSNITDISTVYWEIIKKLDFFHYGLMRLRGAQGRPHRKDDLAFFRLKTTDIPTAYLEIKKLNPFFYGVKKREVVENRMVERFTIVDRIGEEIAVMKLDFGDMQFDKNFTFYNQDKVLSSCGGKLGFISLNGFVSVPHVYDEVVERSDGRFDVRIDNKWGIIDIDGHQVVAIKYKSPISLKYPDTIVKDASCGKLGVLSSDGVEKIPCLYDAIIVTIPRNVPYEGSKSHDEIVQKGCAQYIETDDDKRFIYVGYKAFVWGDGSTSTPTFLSSGIVCENWGCYDNMGKLLIPPYYSEIIVKKKYILAKKNDFLTCPGSHSRGYWRCVLYNSRGDVVLQGGEWDERSSTDKYYVDYEILDDYIVAKEVKVYKDELTYTQSCYLYNKNVELLIGGFNDCIIEEELILLRFGGYWKLVYHKVDNGYDYLNGDYYGDWYDEVWKGKNERWLVLDGKLKSIIRKPDGTDYFFKKGSICKITPKEENGKIINYWSFPLELFSLRKPTVSKGIVIVEKDKKEIAIRIEDGKYSQKYDEIKAIDEDTFFVKGFNNRYIGLCSFEKNIIGIEDHFVFLTIPVQGIVFGVVSDKTTLGYDIVKLLCINTNETPPTQYTAIDKIKFYDLVLAMERGELELLLCSDINDYKQLYVRKIDLFDTEFLDCFPYRIVQIEKEYDDRMYWYSDDYRLKYSRKEKEKHRLEDYMANSEGTPDYLGDTWDAMTDGMYGDMPEGFNGDYSFLGF